MKYNTTGIKQKMDLKYVLTFYDYYLRERSLPKVAAALGIACCSLLEKINKYPDLQLAKEQADKRRSLNVLSGYVLSNLSEEAQQTWKRLRKADTLDDIERIFAKRTTKIRQEVFIYALLRSGFDISKAMKIVGITKQTLTFWRADLEFMQLMEEVQFHKKNFFEKALIGLVAEGHPAAVIFTNRTVNADRGYSEKLELNHSGSIAGDAGGFSIEDLDLDLETQKKVLEAIRRRKENLLVQNAKPIGIPERV